MPSTPPILCITDQKSAPDDGHLFQHLPEHWCGGSFPGVQVLPTDQIGTDLEVSRFCLVMILVDGNEGTNSQMIERMVQATAELEIPIVLLGQNLDGSNPDRPEHISLLSDSTPPEVLAPYLAGIIQRNRRVRTITQEHELTQRLMGNIHREIGQIDEELQSASIVQREFMPKTMPSIGSVSASVLWRPSSYVSGDFYQAVQIDEHRMGLLLADAAGHGVGSALMTIVMARAFKPLDEAGACDPGVVLQRINQALVQIQGGRMQFATGIYVVLDCFEGSLTYACAGHPAPLLLNEDTMEPLDMEDAGPALGIFEEAEYDSMEAHLNEEQSLLLYSDGFEHAFPLPNSEVTDLQSPSNAYMNVFKSLSGLHTTEQMVARLEQAIDGRRGSLQPYDDLTLLCARRSLIPATISRST